ncbi:MAG: sulfotransferase [Verrucomicrobiota bacterium]
MPEILSALIKALRQLEAPQGSKIFCIGRNKTGTTSLKKALEDFGIRVGCQHTAEKLFPHYKERNFQPVIEYCASAEAFQDIPFSLPYTFIALDQAFPGSKFILTVRDEDRWFDSLVRFQSKMHGRDGALCTVEDLRNDPYCYKGFVYETKKYAYCLPDDDLYNREIWIEHYRRHNAMVADYFRFRPDDLLTIDIGEASSYKALCRFLGRTPLYERFPWENQNPPNSRNEKTPLSASPLSEERASPRIPAVDES